jgi:hypothetical protein
LPNYSLNNTRCSLSRVIHFVMPLQSYVKMMGHIAHDVVQQEAVAAHQAALDASKRGCHICFVDFPEIEGVLCGGAEPHFLCNGCVAAQVNSACTDTAAGLGSEFFTVATNKNGVTR